MKSFNLNVPDYSESLTKSLVTWMDSGFATYSTAHSSGNLSQKSHPAYAAGYVWGSNVKNWRWDAPAYVYVGGVLQTSGFQINYRDGLVIFSSSKTNANAEYDYKKIDVIDAKDNDFFRGEASHLTVFDGTYRANAVQLPLVAVETADTDSDGYELGSYTRDVITTILVNVIAKTKEDCNKIADAVYRQIDGTFELYNFNQANRSGFYPLDAEGFLVNSSGTYNALVSGYPVSISLNNRGYIENADRENVNKLNNNMYHCTIRYYVSTVLDMNI